MLHELGSANPALRELARELHAYLTGASTAVLERVKAAVQPDTTVLVGHGLGAVVAYDLLRRDSLGQQIKVLVTLGAPLGLAAVRTALNVPEPLVPPDGVLWMNVLDPDDVRTGGEGLADLGPGITDGYVDNGDRASAATAYLAQGQTGRAILNGV
jgi:hypothetical protein